LEAPEQIGMKIIILQVLKVPNSLELFKAHYLIDLTNSTIIRVIHKTKIIIPQGFSHPIKQIHIRLLVLG